MCTKAVRAGRFREDLFCQLNVIPIYKPPLNERKDDIILPADYYLKRYAVEYKRAFIGLKAEQMKRTSLYARMRTLGNIT
jgi:transcriptional regulator with GAF, ATPase, and Fis domain